MIEPVPKLILGTAQLGMNYGIANSTGQPDHAAAEAIVATALDYGITHFDTAQAYGTSEQVLGTALRALGGSGRARITTKLAATIDPTDAAALRQALDESFARLGVQQLWAVLLHRPEWLTHWSGPLGGVLLDLKREGLIEHLGVSLLDPVGAPAALAHPDLSIVQLTANAWDRRAQGAGVFDYAREAGKLVCVRSVYLQGLLTLPPDRVAQKLPAAAEASRRWHDFCTAARLAPTEAALRCALALDAPLVIGAESATQLRQTIALSQLPPLPADTCADLQRRLESALSDDILDPWRWPAQG